MPPEVGRIEPRRALQPGDRLLTPPVQLGQEAPLEAAAWGYLVGGCRADRRAAGALRVVAPSQGVPRPRGVGEAFRRLAEADDLPHRRGVAAMIALEGDDPDEEQVVHLSEQPRPPGRIE